MLKKEFNPMSEIEITIRKINDIKMVHIYELTGANLSAGVSGLVAIAVTYGDNQQLNLSENDEGFQSLVNRVYTLYNANSNILMDETTRALLDGGFNLTNETLLDEYYKLEPAEYPLIVVDSVMSKRFLSVVEYLINSLYQLFDIEIHFLKSTAGWRGAMLFEVESTSEKKTIFAKTTKLGDGMFAISITNILKLGATLLVNVRIGFDDFEISFVSEALELSGVFGYSYKDKLLRESKEIFHEDKSIYYDVVDRELVDDKYILPFGLEYKVSEKTTVSGDIESTEYVGCYTWTNADFSEVKGWTEVFNVAKKLRLKIHSAHYQSLELRDGRCQTYFIEADGNASERYRNCLQGKYFVV